MSLSQFLQKHKVAKGEAYNFTRFSKPFGSFFVPDASMDEFYSLYKATMEKNRVLSLTEKQGSCSPFIVDIDLKYPSDTSLIKNYSSSTINILTKSIFEFFGKYIDITDVHCYVHERPAPYRDSKSVVKDGFHLLFPDIRCKLPLKLAARDHIIATCKDCLADLNSVNSITDIVDKAVVGRNNWFVYGCGKSETKPYLLTDIIDKDGNRIDLSHDPLSMIKLFSVRGDIETVKLLSPAGDASLVSSMQRMNLASTAPSRSSDEPTEEVQYDLLERVVMGLADWRAEAEPVWIEIVWSILYTSQKNSYIKKGRDLIHKFSQKAADAYDENAVENKISRIQPKEDGKKFGSLVFCLKQDNPDLYSELFGPRRDYQSVKARFEKEHFKTLDPSGFYRQNEHGLFPKRKRELMDDFENMYFTETIKEKTIKIPFLKLWFTDEHIRTYRTIDFLPPPRQCPSDVYNLFNGLRAASLPAAEDADISLIWDLLTKLCGNDPSVFEYTKSWLAHIVQKPGELSRTGLLWQSLEGCGKNLFLDWFGKIVLGEQYYFTTTNIQDLFGDFAIGLKHRLLVNMNEAAAADTHTYIERIKSAITDATINYQAKHVNTVVLSNYARILFSTNNERAIKCGVADRRWVAVECDNTRCNDSSYFRPLTQIMNDQSARAFYDDLRNVDITNWDPTKRPFTKLYRDLKAASVPVLARWLAELVEIDTEVHNEGAGQLLKQYKLWCSENGFHKASLAANVTNFGTDLKKYKGITMKHTRVGNRYNFAFEELEIHLQTIVGPVSDSPFLD